MASSSDELIARFLALHPKIIDLSLGRIIALMEKLGEPQKRLPPVIHVAGTNGKGSTIAFMRAILEAAGLAVHVYTSPHLVRFHERIRLGRKDESGRLVDEDALTAALAEVERVNAGAPITVFEITTATAFHLFAQHPADVLLLEVGLGGRFDATNIIDHPLATVVTPVSMDHMEFLGDTIRKIAGEKAGILKRGAPAIIARQGREATAVLEEAAGRAGASSILIGGQDFAVHEEGGRLIYQDNDGLLDLPLPRLPGRHQQENAGTAIAALRAAGFSPLPDAAFEAGMRNVEWPARLQRLREGALVALAPEGSEIWLDGGHNEDGAKALAAAMADLQDRKPAPLILICGLLGTKDLDAVLRPFPGLAQELIAVTVPGQMVARPAQEIAAAAQDLGLPARDASSVEEALRQIAARGPGNEDRNRNEDRKSPPRILICGSLYLAGEVLKANGTPPV